ncbi:MAG: MerR family transcriptional regulator [Anaerolineae bacterium]|nr:MerR family transcriptional regulator [Anaerolineae bacterium]
MNSLNALTPQHASDEPLYNIGVVSRMTGIPVATLRVWERRYDFPTSARTEGGHRLYSEREILRLRWVKARIDDGMQTGRAIRALQHHEEEGDILPDGPISSAGAARPIKPATRRPSEHLASASMEAIHQRLTGALLNHDLEQANQIIGDALAVHSLEALLTEVLPQSLITIGQAWHDGEINVATEHLATNFVRNRLLMWMNTGPATHNVPPVVLACAPDEWHEMTLLIFGVLLRRLRWPVAYLGQALPLPDLAAFIRETGPDAVVLVATTEEGARKLAGWPDALPEVAQADKPLMTFAGAAFTDHPDLQASVQGLYLGDTIQAGLDVLDELLRERYGLR